MRGQGQSCRETRLCNDTASVRLGLSGSDIKKLCFSDIDREKETLTVTQQKTKERLILPLTNELGMALIDYLKEGRPVSSEPYIFLALRAPYQPLSRENHLHQVLNKYIRRSGVVLCADQAHGMYSLRHTLASTLLEQGTDSSSGDFRDSWTS